MYTDINHLMAILLVRYQVGFLGVISKSQSFVNRGACLTPF